MEDLTEELTIKLEDLQTLSAELREDYATACEEIKGLKTKLERAADQLADAGLIINTPHSKYRWVNG